jgi:hypothetical protein
MSWIDRIIHSDPALSRRERLRTWITVLSLAVVLAALSAEAPA